MKKKILMLLLLVVCCLAVTAKKKEIYSCVLTLNNGQQIKGWVLKEKYKNYGPDMMSNIEEFTITTNKADQKGTKYCADDAKEILLTDEKSGEQIKFITLYANKVLTQAKNLLPTKHKYFWLQTYKGKKVYGFFSEGSSYTSFFSGPNGMSTTRKEDTGVYSYSANGDQVAITFYVSESGMSIGQKSSLKSQFARFPKLVEYIDSDNFKLKDFKKDPFSLLVKLDEILSRK